MHDFRDPVYLSWLFSLLDSGIVSVMHLGIECRTFSRVCKPALRTPTEVNGKSSLSKVKQNIVDGANLYASNAVKALLHANKLNIPVFAENPQSSMLWQFGDMYKEIMLGIGKGNGWYEANPCYCRFGKPYLNRTNIISNRPHVMKLNRPCKCENAKHPETLTGKVKLVENGQTRLRWLQLIQDDLPHNGQIAST